MTRQAAEPERIAIGPGGESVAWVGSGLLEEAASRLFSPSGRFLLVSSAGARSAAERVRAALRGSLLLDLEIDDREESKNLQSAGIILDAALSVGVRRDDALVAVGGGVVSDVAGFAAAILLRGIAWNAVPTTTGAMADAALGGKTGVDHREGKNLIGAFHPPRVVLIDPSTARTLPERDYRAGLVEAFKAAWIADDTLARNARQNLGLLLARETRELSEFLCGAARIKAAVVSADAREAGGRRILNFGHTLGHAFEAASGLGGLRHGEAVAWGIAAALILSRQRAGLAREEELEVRRVLASLGPFPEPERDPERLRPFLLRDKKASARGIAGVLLERIGRARVEESIAPDEWLAAASELSLSS